MRCTETFNYEVRKPREFAMRSNRFEEWEREIRGSINTTVQAVVLLLPGQKGKAPLYDDLKRLLIKEIPVPSQVVICNTIAKGKNVRSICNKILIQICAKIGGEPWAINQMPFMNKPTMICGMDVYHKAGSGNKSILAFSASLNQTATRYWSSAKVQEEGQEISNTLQQIVSEALNEFKIRNGTHPHQMIIYRDGLGDSQHKAMLMHEIPQIQLAINNVCRPKEVKLMVVLVNKRVNQRFFGSEIQNGASSGSGRLSNPRPGTVVDTDLVAADGYDFFMIS